MKIEVTTLNFLKALKNNNNKEWFDKNRDKFAAAKANHEAFVNAFIAQAVKLNKGLIGLEAKHCTFRIFRDVRFSKDKSPYKNNFGAAVSEGGRKSIKAGFYIHIEPGNHSFVGGGMWMPEGDVIKKVRQEIDYNHEDFEKILNDKKFKTLFGTLSSEYKLSNPPKGYDKLLPHIELLKYNSYIAGVDSLSDKDVCSENFLKKTVDTYKVILPLLNFLNAALD